MIHRWVFGFAVGVVLLLTYAPLNFVAAADRVWRLGWLDLSPLPSTPNGAGNLEAFLQGMRELGYVEKRDFVIDPRFADAHLDRLPALARELVDGGADMILTVGTATAVAAKQVTDAIPIVMTGGESPIERGLIASYAHPGSNVTGLTHKPSAGFWLKGVQLLKQAVPNISRLAVLTGGEIEDARGPEGLTILSYPFRGIHDQGDRDKIFSKIAADHADSVFVFPDFAVINHQQDLEAFISAHRLPTMTEHRPLVETVGLLYYYTDFLSLRRRAATYVDKIMHGAKASELPVEQPAKFQFIVNLKTAKSLGLTMPGSIIDFANEVIE